MRFLLTSKSEKASSITGFMLIKSPLRLMIKNLLHRRSYATFAAFYCWSYKRLCWLIFCAILNPNPFVPVQHSIFIFAVKLHAPNRISVVINSGFWTLYRLCHAACFDVFLRRILNRLLHDFLPSSYHIQRQIFIIQALRKNRINV